MKSILIATQCSCAESARAIASAAVELGPHGVQPVLVLRVQFEAESLDRADRAGRIRALREEQRISQLRVDRTALPGEVEIGIDAVATRAQAATQDIGESGVVAADREGAQAWRRR